MPAYRSPVVLTYFLIWGSWVLFGLLTAWALAWAATHGQLRGDPAAASVIFDAEEPIGLVTDGFPNEGSTPSASEGRVDG